MFRSGEKIVLKCEMMWYYALFIVFALPFSPPKSLSMLFTIASTHFWQRSLNKDSIWDHRTISFSSVNITYYLTASAPLQQVNCGPLRDVAFWLWATIRHLELMRHLDNVSHFRYMQGPALETLHCKDSAVGDRAKTASAIITGPLKSFTEFSCPPLWRGSRPRGLCSGISIVLITTPVIFGVAKKRAFRFLFGFVKWHFQMKGCPIIRKITSKWIHIGRFFFVILKVTQNLWWRLQFYEPICYATVDI